MSARRRGGPNLWPAINAAARADSPAFGDRAGAEPRVSRRRCRRCAAHRPRARARSGPTRRGSRQSFSSRRAARRLGSREPFPLCQPLIPSSWRRSVASPFKEVGRPFTAAAACVHTGATRSRAATAARRCRSASPASWRADLPDDMTVAVALLPLRPAAPQHDITGGAALPGPLARKVIALCRFPPWRHGPPYRQGRASAGRMFPLTSPNARRRRSQTPSARSASCRRSLCFSHDALST